MEHCLKMGEHSTSQMQLNMTYASKLKVSFSKKKLLTTSHYFTFSRLVCLDTLFFST